MAERDSKGRFVKGNTLGKRFKPSSIDGKQTDIARKGGSVTKAERTARVAALLNSKPLTRDEADKLVRIMLMLTVDELAEFAENKQMPVLLTNCAKSLLNPKKGFDTVMKLLDLAFGKPKQQTDITTNGGSIAPQFVIKDGGQADKLKQLEEL